MSENTTLRYIHQDHLGGTALMTSDNGTLISSIDYMPYGETRAGDVPTDKKFTGQRLDDTGLYYYGARYYDPTIGRFISPDTVIPDPVNPQAFNRYSYCLNNPLKYVDPTGHIVKIGEVNIEHIEFLMKESYYFNDTATYEHYAEVITSPEYQAYDTLRGVAPELTGYLESAQDVVNIVMTAAARKEAEFIPSNFGTHQVLIHPVVEAYLDRGWLSNAQFSGVLGHELFHGAIRIGTGVRDKFAANEAFAYSFQSIVEQKLGGGGHKPFNVEINPWLPSNELNDNLTTAAEQLYDYAPKLYSQGWWFWRKPLNNWSKQDKNGAMFLTVAKAVWIK